MNHWLRLFFLQFKSVFLSPSHYLAVLLFFIAASALIPLTLGAIPNKLSIISASIVWVLLLLGVLLVMQNLFFEDLKSGLIEQLIVSNHSLMIWVWLKVLVYFLLVGLPLILISPLIAVSLYFDSNLITDFYLILILLTPSLFFLASIGACFAAWNKGSFILLSMITLPLCIPLLIISAGALEAVSFSLSLTPYLKILFASLLLTGTFCPWISGKILRVLFQ